LGVSGWLKQRPLWIVALGLLGLLGAGADWLARKRHARSTFS
jgi:hypothetical protein